MGHVLDHMLDYMLDHILDYMIMGFVTTALQTSHLLLKEFVFILRVSLYFTPNTIYKGTEVFKVFPEKIFKLWLGYCHSFIVMLFFLKLLLSNQSMQKQSYK